jgi:hypothetical protein
MEAFWHQHEQRLVFDLGHNYTAGPAVGHIYTAGPAVHYVEDTLLHTFPIEC